MLTVSYTELALTAIAIQSKLTDTNNESSFFPVQTVENINE